MPHTSHADVLIMTVNRIESRAVLTAFEAATGKKAKPVAIGDKIYRDLGTANGARVFLALSEMGTTGPGASIQAVGKGIAALQPAAVVMVGIAFGVNDTKQALGDILVSRQLMLYELQRVGAQQLVPRGDRVHASTWLIDYLSSAELDWSGGPVRIGLMLTGEKLIDSLDYREQLKKLEVEAIGGEMEGGGLYVACQDTKVDWVLVKAICDWADGNKAQDKDARQQQAAKNAADFVVHALHHAPLQRPGSARKNTSEQEAVAAVTQHQEIGSFNVSGSGNLVTIHQSSGGELRPVAPTFVQAEPRRPRKRRPTRNSLRTLLGEVLRTSSELRSFFIDWFPRVSEQVSDGMDRHACESLLFQLHDTDEIFANLRQHDAARVNRHEAILAWEES